MDDQQSPHGPGIAKASGGAEATRSTPACTSNYPTDDPLEHAGDLPEGSSKRGLTSQSLGDIKASDLDKGFSKEPDAGGYPDGHPEPTTDTFEKETFSGDALTGFLGRTGPYNR